MYSRLIANLEVEELEVVVSLSVKETGEREGGVAAIRAAIREDSEEGVVWAKKVYDVDLGLSEDLIRYAVEREYVRGAIIGVLCELGADVNRVDARGRTLLHTSSSEVCRILLEHGADVNAVDNDGESPLLCASLRDFHVCRLLLAYGASVEYFRQMNGRQVDGMNRPAAPSKYMSVIDEFSEADAAYRGAGGKGRYIEIVRDQFGCGITPFSIHHCLVGVGIRRGNPEEVAFGVRAARANLSAGIFPGVRSAVEYAILQGDYDRIVRVLVEVGGVDPNGKCTMYKYKSQSYLHCAAREGRAEVCRYLAGAGADVDAVDDDGNTPLHLAAARGLMGVCEVLDACGARGGVVNKRDETAAGSAMGAAHEDVALYLVKCATRDEAVRARDGTAAAGIGGEGRTDEGASE
jgi:hypothetical protein